MGKIISKKDLIQRDINIAIGMIQDINKQHAQLIQRRGEWKKNLRQLTAQLKRMKK